MTQKITDIRRTIEFLEERGELLVVKGEVDPIYEIAGIQKALENGPVLLFENIKGYPAVRDIGNIFSREERVAALFGVARLITSAATPSASTTYPTWEILL